MKLKPVKVTVYYLVMNSPRPARLKSKRKDLAVIQAEIPLPPLNRFLYTAVGGPWYWMDRLGWGYRDWQKWLEQPDVETWVAYHRGTPVGFYELQRNTSQTMNMAYFGLIPEFIGQGFGGALLSHAIQCAWKHEPDHITLNTCSLDHPHALGNYQARGFKIYREATEIRHLPKKPPGPWPDA